MGLSLPSSGTVYLDANAFIYSVERIEPFRSLLEPVWHAAQKGQFEIVSSELVILETFVKPLKEGDDELLGLFRDLLHAREVRLIPASASIWEEAARWRATTGLKTPDALHAATALAAESQLFLTNDPHFRRISELSAVILSDLVKEEP